MGPLIILVKKWVPKLAPGINRRDLYPQERGQLALRPSLSRVSTEEDQAVYLC